MARSLTRSASSGFFVATATPQCFIRVSDITQIRRTRTRIQVVQQRIVTLETLNFSHLAVLVVQITEDDGLCRANLSTGSDNFTVPNATVFFFRLDLHLLNPLDAVGALLHDPAAANRDVGIAN